MPFIAVIFSMYTLRDFVSSSLRFLLGGITLAKGLKPPMQTLNEMMGLLRTC
jgi:hypothetical protein